LPVQLEEEVRLQTELDRSEGWLGRVNEAMQAPPSLTIEEMGTLVTDGDRLRVQFAELKQLKAYIKDAKQWVQRVKKSGIEKGEASVQELESLLQEARAIPIDLSKHTEILKNATQRYCICRGPYEGFMIGCDTCDEWYHGPCVGITESQAARCERWICPRCSIIHMMKSLAKEAMDSVAVSRDPEQRNQQRQLARQKILAKV
jgi:hypothetical protein